MLEKNVAFNVEGIVNEDTSDIIKNAVEQLNGILEVSVYPETKRVTVEFDEERLSEETIKGTIEDAGFIVR
ncbi:MAG: heavy-metal-associated domain-containing protein [Acetivibrionales bacterium]|jgi:copper chaperone CopZ|nr:heavy-metal-associated domain-containing protein [Clostridiaceae bacterium]